MTNLTTVMEQLKRPFPPHYITWKPGVVKGDRCMVLIYADPRAYMEVLDEVCGMDWSVSYQPWGLERIIATVTIMGVTRSSTGEMSASEAKTENGGTVAEAQAFKRACTMFGMGRYLYTTEGFRNQWVDYDAGSKGIANKDALTKRYTDWYNATIAKLEGSSKSIDVPKPQPIADIPMGNPGDIWNDEPATPSGLSDKAMDFISWCNHQADQDPNTVSTAQYGLLSGTIDRVTGRKGSHNAILEMLTLKVVGHDNLPSKVVGKEVLDSLLEHTKDKDTGEYIPNSKFNPSRVEIIKELAAYALSTEVPL